MSGPSKVIIFDPDVRASRQMQLGFEREGIPTAAVAPIPVDATKLALPDENTGLVVVGGNDGRALDLLRRARKLLDDHSIDVPILFAGRGVRRSDAEGAGAHEVVLQPAYLRDVVTIGRLLHGTPPAMRVRLGGSLAETTGVFTLVRALSTLGRSAVLTLIRGLRRGEVRFFHGEVTSAQLGIIHGQAALHQLLLWTDARFEVHHEDVVRRQQIPLTRDELFVDAERFLAGIREESGDLSPSMVLEQDVARIHSLGKQIPTEVHGVLRMFDGHRVLADVLEDSPYRVFETLRVAQRAVEAGLLRIGANPRARAKWRAVLAIEEWLVGSDTREAVLDRTAGDSGNLPSQPTIGPAETASSARRNRRERRANTPLAMPPLAKSSSKPEIDWGALVPRVIGAEVGPLAGVVPAAHMSGEIRLPTPTRDAPREGLEALMDTGKREKIFPRDIGLEPSVVFEESDDVKSARAEAEEHANAERAEAEERARIQRAEAEERARIQRAEAEAQAEHQRQRDEAQRQVRELVGKQERERRVTEEKQRISAEAADLARRLKKEPDASNDAITAQFERAKHEQDDRVRVEEDRIAAAAKAKVEREARAAEKAAAERAAAEERVRAVQRAAEEQARRDASAQEELARREAEQRAAAEVRTRESLAALARQEAEARAAAEERRRVDAEAAAKREAEARAAEERAKRDAEIHARREAEQRAAAERARRDAEAKAAEEAKAREQAAAKAAADRAMQEAESKAALERATQQAKPASAASQRENKRTRAAKRAAKTREQAEARERAKHEPAIANATDLVKELLKDPVIVAETGTATVTQQEQVTVTTTDHTARLVAVPIATVTEPVSEPAVPQAVGEDEPSDGVIREKHATAETAPVPRSRNTAPGPIPEDDRPEDATGEIDLELTAPRRKFPLEPPAASEPSILIADVAAVQIQISAIAEAESRAEPSADMATAMRAAEVDEARDDATSFSDIEEDFFRAGHDVERPKHDPESFDDLDEGYRPVGFWDRLLGRKPPPK